MVEVLMYLRNSISIIDKLQLSKIVIIILVLLNAFELRHKNGISGSFNSFISLGSHWNGDLLQNLKLFPLEKEACWI